VTLRLLIMGLPGAGKGTQAKVLAAALGIPAISTGDIFRDNVRRGTDLGNRAKAFMDAGEYVPDELTNSLVEDRLGQPDADKGFLLDGYPRTLAQVHRLDETLAARGHALDRVIELNGVNASEVVDRLHQRAVDEGRADDSPDVITRRLDVYREQTAPLIADYRERGILREVDALGSIHDVSDRILAVLDELGVRAAAATPAPGPERDAGR